VVAEVRVLILRAAGTNCDLETQHAWERAGARVARIHVRRLIEQPRLLDKFQVLTIPGGFSYGDDIAAGRILAAQVQRHLIEHVCAFVDAGRLVLGICNGFQVLVQAGMLPARRRTVGPRTCTIAPNEPPGFQDRWIYLRAETERCVFLESGRTYELPIAHGEGRVLFAAETEYQAAVRAGHRALLYAAPAAGQPDLHGEPHNPNGSVGDIAGLCDETGRVLGLMPHPERFVDWTQHPCWTSLPPRPEGDGLALFRRAVAYLG
jgi:phosphoribosylformylglycinamidine synthase I